jgi:hypothetical protein
MDESNIDNFLTLSIMLSTQKFRFNVWLKHVKRDNDRVSNSATIRQYSDSTKFEDFQIAGQKQYFRLSNGNRHFISLRNFNVAIQVQIN